MKKTLFFVAITSLALLLQAQELPKKVLFIGNSYTYVNDLPSMIQQLCESTGDRIEFQQVTVGGATFSQQCTTTGAMEKISEGGWDIVVLQAQSQEPSFPWSQFTSQTYPYACQLADAIYENNDCAEVMFYMTWGHKNGDSYNAQVFDSLASYEGMDDLLYERYMLMAQQNRASVSPVGRVWRVLRTEHPEFELYQSDDSHPSTLGSYAAACTFYTLIFRKDPTTITTNLTIDATTAETIRETAKAIVYDSLYRYSCHTFPVAEAENDSLHWQFRCLSAAEPETVLWDFGDGETSTEANPTHTFAPGTHTITLTAGKTCEPDTTTIVIITSNPETPEDPENPNSIFFPIATNDMQLSLYPNPATSHITVKCSRTASLRLLDSKGRTMLETTVSGEETLDITKLPTGIYIVSVDDRVSGKFLKK